MARSFGMDTRPVSARWADVIRGPSKKEVRAHVAKLAAYARSHQAT